MYLFKLRFSPDIFPEVGLLDHIMLILFLVFKGNSVLFFIVTAPIHIPTNSIRGFLFHHTFSSIYLSSIF